MIKVVVPGNGEGQPQRLVNTGMRIAPAPSPSVPALDTATADDVWLIPQPVFHGDDWNRLRVELGRAPRFFIVHLAAPLTEEVVAAMRDGAFDVLADSDPESRWIQVIHQAADHQRLWLQLYSGQVTLEGGRLVGRSLAMMDLRRDLERLGPTDVTVLLLGESGVGKERVAGALHEAGRGGPMVNLNCAAMPRELLEAELFGAEKGAFTGAVRTRPGLVEQASGGTLFLDEVGELDLSLQPKLLRFLETRRARRVGGDVEYEVRLRVVAATNRDLEKAVNEGQFRADLFYRLAEVVLRIPPLRERKEDIPALVRAFVAGASERFGKHFDTVEPGLLVRLQDYSWPGNVRELKSVIDRLALFHDGPVLRAGWWEPPVQAASASTVMDRADAPRAQEPVSSLPSRGARLELAQRLLDEGKLSLSEIAARAGVHPTTLFRWRKSGKTRG
jgi:DNA-binding NtrC family response regulator